ncbi:protein OSCP1-like isoform X3 [Mizuhopecten yessoensis]|uniref:Protein OSCP1 n=1 Tax=Mizuhopecten yessoensis TaxID=6573 RepID=A0A210PRT6_MIZYE|nr:protein OSCP1-like isoform X3 [Mizuhopecten yessoensis]OWF39164.1 Protein OSCP1 [Mizuhopecten yessoensis]
MSFKTLPLLFINLGGEMIYILDQRLRAQNIADEKAKKVLHDIIATMYHKRFMEELFKPQPLYSKKAMRTVFDRLAHASIMRLNAASMDKLYDLMTMAFKFQVSLSLRPKDIILTTLNHIDAIKSLLDGAPQVQQQVDHVYRLLIETFGSLSLGEFQLIRQTLLNFFQDMHIRVSIFLKDKVQSSNGRFVLPDSGTLPWKTESPGTIRLYDASGNVRNTSQFPANGNFVPALQEGSFDIKGSRVTKLGTNMYSVVRTVETISSGVQRRQANVVSDIESNTPDPLAKAQLDLLSTLIGGRKSASKQEIRLNLFNNDQEEDDAAEATMKPIEMAESKVVKIDASKKQRGAELNKIMGELNVQDSASHDDDLLDLMDSA